jgi:hypothetical protein
VRVRTVIAPLPREVEAQLEALDARLAGIARRYIRRLALEPQLGHPLTRGYLASRGVRAVYFDRSSDPDDLFGRRRPRPRAGGQDLAVGPRWRVVYRAPETRDGELRVIVVLGVGVAHPASGAESIYVAAERLLRRLWKEQR